MTDSEKDLLQLPQNTLTPDEFQTLVAYIESLLNGNSEPVAIDPELLDRGRSTISYLLRTQMRPGGDYTEVRGNIGPGSQLGSGTTINEGGVAGRDVIHTELYAHNVKNLTVGGKPATDPSTLLETYLGLIMNIARHVPLGQISPDTARLEHCGPEVTLDSIYIHLNTTSTRRSTNGGDSADAPVSVLEAVVKEPRLVILGDPGSGKTTFLNFMTLCLAGACLAPESDSLKRLNIPNRSGQHAVTWRHGPLLPVRVLLREFVQDIPHDATHGTASLVWKHITKELGDHNLAEFGPILKDKLHKGECLVMFDGLDEVPESPKRELVRDAVNDFVTVHQKNRFLITCRILSYNNPKWQLPKCPVVTLASLTQDQIDTFIGAWYDALVRIGHLTPRCARAKREELRKASRRLFDLARNPMLLTVMAVVHTYKGGLPRERVRLYDECVSLLLLDWQRTKQAASDGESLTIMDQLGTRDERLISALCEVAYEAHAAQGNQDGPTNIPQSEMLRIMRRYLDGKWSKAEQYCEYIEERAGLLVGKGEDASGERVYAFPHRSFQEFLAGCHLVSQRDFNRQVADHAAKGGIWREVLLLAAGHLVFNLRDMNRPLDAVELLCPPELPTTEEEWRNVWWAAEILNIVERSVAEQDKHVGKKVVPRVIDRLIALLEGEKLPPRERAQAADMLGRLADPRPGVSTREPEMVLFPAAPFSMGLDGARHTVSLKPFYLARYPVTNAQFREFISSRGARKRKYWTQAGWDWRRKMGDEIGGLSYDPFWGIANRPVVGITWHEAVAYTRWLAEKTGKPYRLPTEAEWERAAAGEEGRLYPWGERWRADIANTREVGVGYTTAVGCFPRDKTPEGLYDMGGNVWEWCSSRPLPYPYRPDDGREDLETPGERALRGGGFDSTYRMGRCIDRHQVDPDRRVALIGLRVAMDAPGK